MIKTDMRAWNKTFSKYLSLRNKDRDDIVHAKARDWAFKAFQALPPTSEDRIRSDMAKNNMLLKITVKRLKAKGINLKNLGTVKVKVKGGAKGQKRVISKADKIIADYSKRLLRSKIRSRGYHRVSFLKLAQLLGRSGSVTINPRSKLAKTNVKEKHTPSSDVYNLNAIARGMDCPSTHVARDAAFAAVKADMEVYIMRKLAQSRKAAGFRGTP